MFVIDESVRWQDMAVKFVEIHSTTFVSMAARPNIIEPTSLKSPGFSSLLNSGGTYGLASLGLRGSPEICSGLHRSLFPRILV